MTMKKCHDTNVITFQMTVYRYNITYKWYFTTQ